MQKFARAAERVANGEGWLLDSLARLERGNCGVADIDLTRRGANAWVVGRDESGGWSEGRVELLRGPDGRWLSESCSTTSWEGWAERGEPRPVGGWPGWGPALGLVFESGDGLPPGCASTSVRGLVAVDVVAVELHVRGRVRRRSVDHRTGAFIIAVPIGGCAASSRCVAVRADGSTIEIGP